MEDGIERMMTPETYNIHFLNEDKNKKTIVKIVNDTYLVNHVKDSIILKESCIVKDISPTNPQ